MRWLLLVVILVCTGIALGMFVREDPGYVFLGYGEWSVETTLALFVAFELVLLAVVYVLLRTLLGILRIPGKLSVASRHRAQQRAQNGLTHGLLELAEGRWERAERLLVRDVERSDSALLHYLAAARAAQHAGAHERRDSYLKRAIESNPQAEFAVSLTQAELQLSHAQTERALASLTRLRNLAPKHEYVTRLLAKLYLKLEDWRNLSQLLPEIARKHLFDPEELESMQRATWQGLLNGGDGNLDELKQSWESIPRSARENAELVRHYAERLLSLRADAEAEPLVRNALSRNWNAELARLYGLIESHDTARQLEVAENWLKNHGRDPSLLLTLGRLCKQRSLWGKARIYFESSLGLNPRPETYLELAELLESLDEKDSALSHYRNGLALSVESPKRRRGMRPVSVKLTPPAAVEPAGTETPVPEATLPAAQR